MFVGWDVAEASVQSGGVEPRDVFDDCELQLASGLPHAVADQLGRGTTEPGGARYGPGVNSATALPPPLLLPAVDRATGGRCDRTAGTEARAVVAAE